MVRCFIGIIIPEELNKSIDSVKDEIGKLPIRCKFVERENLHVCLSFLGEIEEGNIKNISDKLESVCKNYHNFEVVIDGIKMIPSESYIRVLALDVIDRDGNLNKIAKDIQKSIGGDIKPPHVTLCRVKSIDDKGSTVQKVKSIKTEELPFSVSSVQIIKSELRKSGPTYTSIFEAKLK